MSSRYCALWLGSLLVTGLPGVSMAQSADSAQVRVVSAQSHASELSGVSYDTAGYDAKALRLETHMGDFRILRGVDGPVVAKISLFARPDMAALVAPSENAMREGREFNRNYRPGMAAGIVGTAIFAFSLVASSTVGDNWGYTAGTIGGGALMVYGAVRLDRAYSSLSKSIWWYNRDLKK
jgi:hypothetical protein